MKQVCCYITHEFSLKDCPILFKSELAVCITNQYVKNKYVTFCSAWRIQCCCKTVLSFAVRKFINWEC